MPTYIYFAMKVSLYDNNKLSPIQWKLALFLYNKILQPQYT